MIILHGGLLGGRFLVWGEASVPPEGEPSPRGRKPRGQPRPLPFAAAEVALTAALRPGPPRKHGAERVAVWLPTVGGKPVASSSLVADPPANGAAPALAAWVVQAVRLSGPAGVWGRLVSGAVSRPEPAPDARPAPLDVDP
jgi:hypothetical protein